MEFLKGIFDPFFSNIVNLIPDIFSTAWDNIFALGIAGTVIGILFRLLWKGNSKRKNALKHLGGYFLFNRLAEEKNRDVLNAKALLYSGEDSSGFDSDISIERDLSPKIRKLIEEENKNFLHIHISCKLPKQGISMFLNNLNAYFSKKKSITVLEAIDFPGQHAAYNFDNYLKDLPHFIRRWKKIHLVLLIDNAFTGDREKRESQKKVIDSLAKLKTGNFYTRQLKITVVSGNHDERKVPTSNTNSYKLEFSISEEKQIFKRIFKDHPTLVKDFTGEIESFWGWVRNGKNEYGGDLHLFLSLLHEFAKDHNLTVEKEWGKRFDLPVELKTNDDVEKKHISVIAAYSVLGIPLSDKSLINICGEQNIADRIKNLKWVEINSDQTNLEGVKLRPGLARNLLVAYSINEADKLKKRFRLAFNWDLPLKDWSYEELELLRHLFRRLNDNRHNHIKVGEIIIKGTEISLPLYKEIKDSVKEYLMSCDDVGVLSSWANTLSRQYINEANIMGVLIGRIIKIETNNDTKIETSETFVSFASALTSHVKAIVNECMSEKDKRGIKKLIQDGLVILDYEAAYENAKKFNTRRANQVITTYFGLLKQLSRKQAFKFMEEHKDFLDSRGFNAYGKVIENNKVRLSCFSQAKKKALEQIRDFPLDYVRQTLTYMRANGFDYYDEMIKDTERLIDIVGDPRSARFNIRDIESIQLAIEKIRNNPAIEIDKSIMKKLNSFSQHS